MHLLAALHSGPICLRSGAAPAARRARRGRRHGRVDRHLPRGAAADPPGHVRVSHRQRRRRTGRRQPPASGHEPWPRRPARARRAVSDAKHSLEYCLSYAERAQQSGFPALVVLGGDKASASPRRSSTPGSCGSSFGNAIRRSILGGWANPHARCRAAGGLPDHARVSGGVLSDAGREPPPRRNGRRGSSWPPSRRGVRCRECSASSITGARIRGRWRRWEGLFRCPPKGCRASSRPARPPEEICARTIRALLDAGARHFYISNLPIGRAQQVLASVLEKVGVRNWVRVREKGREGLDGRDEIADGREPLSSRRPC